MEIDFSEKMKPFVEFTNKVLLVMESTPVTVMLKVRLPPYPRGIYQNDGGIYEIFFRFCLEIHALLLISS